MIAYHVLRIFVCEHFYPTMHITLSQLTMIQIGLLTLISKKSVSGYVVGDSFISWKSKKQTTIYLSSTKSEYMVVRKVVKELVWLERLLTELHFPCNLPIFDFCDSQAAVHIVKNPVFHERTKHIEVDCHLLQESYRKASLCSIISLLVISWQMF